MRNFYTLFTSIFILFQCAEFNSQTNQYLHFDGIDDFVKLENASQYINGSNTISMTGWFKNDQLSYGQGMMSFRGEGSGSGEMYLIQLNNGTIECRVKTSTGLHQFVAPAGTLQAGIWQHIAWVFDQTQIRLYVDGVLIGASTASGTFSASNRPFSIGKTILPGYNFIYKGGIDEVSLWNIALSQAQIQDMINNELMGNEAGLQLYYKFNQGSPAGNNSDISKLLDYSNDANKNADLYGFALNGNTSNFLGILEAGFQAINFESIPNKLISDTPFDLVATTNSGLPITFEVLSGPATVNGNTVTLDGTTGEVNIKASQAGNAEWSPAADVINTFHVLDPTEVLVSPTLLHPLAGNVFMPNLMPIEISVQADIDFSDIFSVAAVSVNVDGQSIVLEDHGNGFYSSWWTPNSYGAHTLEIVGENNFGENSTQSYEINVSNTASNVIAQATNQVWVSATTPSATVQADLPSHIGAYNQIIANLIISCPPGGCDPWDRISSIDVRGKDGKWYEVIRYLTPYGVACSHQINLTDFASILKGKTEFRINLGTIGNGFQYSLNLLYYAGTDPYPYSTIQPLWNETYAFGDPANLQPAPQRVRDFPENTLTAKIKLLATGHGWGESNTNNAAEFSDNTHHIWVNNQQTFTQHNWSTCNPNPDGCSPQNGTWYFDRAGWCPGSIAPYFDYDMSSFIGNNTVTLDYVFDENYIDYCHPNNPNCTPNANCQNCDDGFNPHLITNSYLISKGIVPLEVLSVEDVEMEHNIQLYPNPSTGRFYIDLNQEIVSDISIYSLDGRQIYSLKAKDNEPTEINLEGSSKGVYIIVMYNEGKIVTSKKIIIE